MEHQRTLVLDGDGGHRHFVSVIGEGSVSPTAQQLCETPLRNEFNESRPE